MVRRLFVEKKLGFDVEAAGLLRDLRETLGFTQIQALRLFNRYDVEGLSKADFQRAKHTIFSEPNLDTVTETALSLPEGWDVFCYEYLPGQYDQRADSAAQCIQLLTGGERPVVASARVIALRGSLSDEQLSAVKAYLINPVESRQAGMALPQTLDLSAAAPADIDTVEGFRLMDDGALDAYHARQGFAMTKEDLRFCRDHFRGEGRDPSITELKVIDTYWSDHCRHTTFSTRLTEIQIEPGAFAPVIEAALRAYLDARREVYGERQKDVCLMDMATMGARLLKKRGLIPDLDESEEINACSIEAAVTVNGKPEQWLIQFKNETHNHPTEIEPFGGAATCLGGAIRDPLSGRAYVYQAMRITGSADPTVPFSQTLPAKLPQKKITTGAAAGYSSYGNQIGLATGQVVELYDAGYMAKRMEIGAVVGASPKRNVRRARPAPGDVILLLGGRTGRDGCGGATGSSKAHDATSIETCGAEVQKGNPPTERKLQRLFRNGEAARLIKRCNDFGAGGVCVAIGELADGLDIDLDAVPCKYNGLDGTELAISESQERMAVVLDPADVGRFTALAAQENLEAAPVAIVSETARLVMRWRGKTIVDLPRAFLNTNGVTGTAAVRIASPDPEQDYRTRLPKELAGLPLEQAFLHNLSRLNVCSQRGLAERFDASIGASSVLMPFAGKNQLTPEEGMVAKLPIARGETDDATAMTYGFIPGISRFSPFHGAVWAVMESLAKLAALGCDPQNARLTFQEYFPRLGGDPLRWGLPAAALLGAFWAQAEMGVPSIGGKDSMSGSFNELDVPPTLVSFALGMTRASRTGSAALQARRGKLLYVPLPSDTQTSLPDFTACKGLFSRIAADVAAGRISACAVVKEGGAAAAAAKMAFGNDVGVDFACLDPQVLFAPQAGGFVLQADDAYDCECTVLLGWTNDEPAFCLGTQRIPLDKARAAWQKTLSSVFPEAPDTPPEDVPALRLHHYEPAAGPAIRTAKPRVFIPVLPGTNCEADTARAFEKAGALPEVLVMRNLTPAAVNETAQAFAQAIERAQIVMLPGGFSGGDEPDGSGKLIATMFRGPRMCEAVERLLYVRDGLMLGICNGFQALVKLGLLPFGHIKDLSQTDPTLTFNTIGRHVSRMAYTRVVSAKSPWLSLCEAGQTHAVPISHGEGRFIADMQTLRTLDAQGQIATQYVDCDGRPAATGDWNPNGSLWAIEGVTSPDGRIFGKMGHSERVGSDCYKNVPGGKDQRIFEAGVAYFK